MPRRGKSSVRILEEARRHFDGVVDIPWPPELGDLSPSPPGFWAEKRQQTRDLIQWTQTDPRNVWPLLQYMQRVGFDHRGPRTDGWLGVVWEEIESRFPSFSLQSSPLCESIYSDFITLLRNKLVSNIFFYHLEAYLSCTQRLCPNPSQVLEIGGGYGAVARLFKQGHPSVCYTIVDMPESLYFAEVFLRVNFPDCNLQYHRPDRSLSFADTDFCLVPIQYYSPLTHIPFDLVIIQGVLGEVTADALRFWIDFLENSKVRAVYSLNLSIAPLELNSFEVVYREDNPSIVRADSDMEWLELCLKRKR